MSPRAHLDWTAEDVLPQHLISLSLPPGYIPQISNIKVYFTQEFSVRLISTVNILEIKGFQSSYVTTQEYLVHHSTETAQVKVTSYLILTSASDKMSSKMASGV